MTGIWLGVLIYVAVLFFALAAWETVVAASWRATARERARTIRALRLQARELRAEIIALQDAARVVDLRVRRDASRAESLEALAADAWQQRTRMQRQLARATGPGS